MKLFKAGFEFGLGAFVAVCFAWTFAIAIASSTAPRDDCDSPDERCGMRVLTDHKTGLQYLEAQGGGIIPRLTLDGEQMREDSQ